MEMIGELLQRKEPSASRSAFHAAETPLEKVLEQLSSQSLFGSHDIVMLDHVQELKKEGREALAPFLRSPSPFVTAISAEVRLNRLPISTKWQRRSL